MVSKTLALHIILTWAITVMFYNYLELYQIGMNISVSP